MLSLFRHITVFIIPMLLCGIDVAHAGAASGKFLYAEVKKHTRVDYKVQAVEYQGTSAWKVTWNYPDIDAEHYIRQSDSAPLYVKRVNRILHQTVEVFYSIEAEKPHLYTRRTANKFYEKKIWKIGLRDLGTLPQMLLDLKESKDAAGIVFPAIQYSDGEVYDLLAKKRGYRRNSIDGRAVASIVYHININSWLSILSPPVKIELPKHDKNINFFTYSGPDLANSGDISTFHLSHKATELASQKQKEDQR